VTPFHISHEFSGPQERFWQAYFHRDYLEALREVTGMGPAEELELEVTDQRVVRRVRREPRRQIPAFVRKVTGANLVFEEREELDRTTCRMACQIYRAGADELIMLGDYSTAPVAEGRFRRVFAGSIDVRVPLVGGRIERLILADMTRTFEATLDVMQRWLDGAMPAEGMRL